MKEPMNYNNKQHHSINNNNNNSNSNNNNLNIPSPNFNSNRSTFREHIRAKNSYQDLMNSNNNNNNSSSPNNNLTNNNTNSQSNQNLSPKYAIQQTNTSNKILDNQKYHKYFSKRKMMAQYELEMRNEKKHKLSLPTPPAAHQQKDQSDDKPVPLYAKGHLQPPQTEPEELTTNETNNNSSATANNNTISNHTTDVQIKVEPDVVQRNSGGVMATVATAGVNDDEEEDSSNSEKYFLADLRKRKHSNSTIEQTLALSSKKEASTACS